MSELETCGSCGLLIGHAETGLRHFGWYTPHSERRCVELLRPRTQELERDLSVALQHKEAAANGLGQGTDVSESEAA